MSVLAKIRGELLSNLDSPDPRVKRALINLYDAVDSDLDVGYTPSSTVEDALDEYNNALAGMDVEEVEETIAPTLEEVEIKEEETEES